MGGFDALWLFECEDLSQFPELTNGNALAFDFKLDTDRARAWLRFGIGQRIRFFPEMLTSLIPKLFARSGQRTQFQTLKKLYAAQFKNGWNVLLRDEQFERAY